MSEVENTLIDHMALADLTVSLPRAVRLQRLVGQLKARFGCEAVVLLQEEGEALRPVAAEGLSREALGRAFEVGQHPRLSTILLSREVVHFEHASTLPDPYDGLVEGMAGHPLPVHDCMGASVHIDGRRWGVLTLDALQPGAFDAAARDALKNADVILSLDWIDLGGALHLAFDGNPPTATVIHASQDMLRLVQPC